MTEQKRQECVKVLSQEEISDGIFSLWVQSGQIARTAAPGQFAALYCRDKSRLLPRPVSICETDPAGEKVRFVYRIAGAGTAEFSGLRAGDILEITGPLGNGYPAEEIAREDGSAMLVGGGIGIPPLLELARRMKCRKTIILGYRDSLFLADEFAAHGTVYLATEDGNAGTKGNVMDCIREQALSADRIFACGPTPMLRSLQQYAREKHLDCYLSLEQRMACGIGACLACICHTTETDGHSGVKNARICAEGPVFKSTEIELKG